MGPASDNSAKLAIHYKVSPAFGSDRMSNIISRKPLIFEFVRRSKKSGQRGIRIESALVMLLLAFAALQASLLFRSCQTGHRAQGSCFLPNPATGKLERPDLAS